MPDLIIQLGWVKHPVITQYKGITYDSLKFMCSSGKLIEGHHFKTRDGVRYYHFERIDEYVEHGTKAA